MRTFSWSSSVVLVLACGSSSSPADGSSDTGSTTSAVDTGTSLTTSPVTTPSTDPTTNDASTTAPVTTDPSSDEGSTTAAADMGVQPVDPCVGTAFCEPFEDYAETSLADGQTFGPWRAALTSPGATMDLDGTHTVSGDHALHVRLEGGGTSGGRLFASDGAPVLADAPTHLYGRMMMYIEENGTSIHWTFFGVQGGAEPSAPLAGNYASYIMSSLPRDGVNTYSFVDGLDTGGYYQDCWAQGMQPMPTGEWTCIAFEMDGTGRHLRMYTNDDPAPIVSVDETGQGCVDPAPGDSVWYGPEVNEMFVGAWSFHPMDAPLEVWIDDLVVDTVPVPCE